MVRAKVLVGRAVVRAVAKVVAGWLIPELVTSKTLFRPLLTLPRAKVEKGALSSVALARWQADRLTTGTSIATFSMKVSSAGALS